MANDHTIAFLIYIIYCNGAHEGAVISSNLSNDYCTFPLLGYGRVDILYIVYSTQYGRLGRYAIFVETLLSLSFTTTLVF